VNFLGCRAWIGSPSLFWKAGDNTNR